MKKIIIIFNFLLTSIYVFAQNYQEVLYLKNGSIIRGTVIEQVPNQSIKVQTSDGSVFAYPMTDVEKITKEVVSQNQSSNQLYQRQYNQSRQSSSDGSYHPKGYRGFVEVGGSKEFGWYGGGNFNFAMSHGFQVCPYFYIGAGAGVEYHGGLSTVFVPIFGNLRTNFIDKKYTPFLDVKAGYSPVDGMGVYFSPSLGVSFGVSPKCCINFSVGYTMQGAKFDYYYYSYYYDYAYSDSDLFHALTFKLGVEF